MTRLQQPSLMCCIGYQFSKESNTSFATLFMHHTAPVYLNEQCVAVSVYQGHANLRSAGSGDLSVAANKFTI